MGDGSEGFVLNLELVGGGCRTSVGDGDGCTAGGGGHLHVAGCGVVGDHVVGRATSDAGGEGACTHAAVGGVNNAEDNRIADLKVQVGSDGKGVGGEVNVGGGKLTQSAGGFVIEGT